MKKALSVLLVLLMLFSLLSVSASAKPGYRLDGLSKSYSALMANGDDEMILGSISAKYESNGDPGRIAPPESDPLGGASYGAYMFASRYGVPLAFAEWCVTSGEGVAVGSRLTTAYRLDGADYGDHFNDEWRKIAAEDAQGFLLLQHNFVKATFYDVVVARLSRSYADFNIENYTMALKNVIWSRAVHHGVNSSVIFNAIDKLGGTWSGHTEEELIRGIYAESACLLSSAPSSSSVKITAESAQKLGLNDSLLSGRYLRYFSHQPSYTQASVFKRLTVSEPQDVFEMYTRYSGRSVSNKVVSPNLDDQVNTGLDPIESDPILEPTPIFSFIAAVFEAAVAVFKMAAAVFKKAVDFFSALISQME